MSSKKASLVLPVLGALFALAASAGTALAEEVESAHADQPGLVSPNLSSIVWVIVFFLIVLVILYKSAWKNVLAGLKAREDRIRKAIEDSERARVAAQTNLEEYNKRLSAASAEVSSMIAKATQDAEHVATQIKMQAQKDAEEIKSKAIREIDSARDQALSEVYAQAAQLSTAIAEKILKRNLNADDQRDLVNQSLQQLQGVGAGR